MAYFGPIECFRFLGSVIVLACVLGGFVLEGGQLLALWHPTEILIIVGAALGAFMTSNPPKVSKAAFVLALDAAQGRALQARGLRHAAQAHLRHPDEDSQGRRAGHRSGHRDSPRRASCSRSIRSILDDHHMVVFITDCLRLITGGNPRSARAREPARIRARDASQGSARTRARGAEGGGRAAGLRHRGGGARHREHHVGARRRGHRDHRSQGGRGAGRHLPRHPGGLRFRRPDRGRDGAQAPTKRARPSKS